MSTGGWIFTALWTVIVLAILAAAVVWIVSALRNPDAVGSASGNSPREILDRRLANGELTLEQYGQVRAALGASSSEPTKSAGAPG